MNKAKEFIELLQKAHDHTTGTTWRVVATSGSSEYMPRYGVTSYDEGSFPNIVHADSDREGFGHGSSLPNALFIAEAHAKVPVLTYTLSKIIQHVENNGSITSDELEKILVVDELHPESI